MHAIAGNHKTIFQDAGMEVAEYRYWNSAGNNLDFAGMQADISVRPVVRVSDWCLTDMIP